MKIKKIRLKNGYKRFFDLTIDLGDNPRRIIVLVGPNGCGKSSILDGMLFHANAWGHIGNKNPKGFEYHSMNRQPNYDYTNVEIEFNTGSFESLQSEKKKTGHEKTIFSFRSPYRYNSNLKVSESKATPEIKLNGYGATSSSDLDDKMEDNYRRLNIKYTKYLNETDCKPSEARKKIIGDLNASLKKCLDIEISGLGDIEDSKGTIFFKKLDHSSEFEFNVLSSGEKEVVDILLDLYLRKEEYSDTIFLLDEPELHINTSIQKNLLLEINRLIGPDCQIWITTHSIGFLRALQENLKDESQIILFKDGLNLASEPQVLKPIKRSILNWREIFTIALDDISHLVSPKRIVYCEGRGEPGKEGIEQGLDAIIYNNIFYESHPDTYFVSSGGNTELDQRSSIAIAILSKVFTKIEILVLKDRDMASGKKTSQDDREKYLLASPQNHRVLQRLEIENYLYDKSVLEGYSKFNGLSFDSDGYDALVKDIFNDNLKDQTGAIKKLCGITFNISKEQFKIDLSEFITKDMLVFQELEQCIFLDD
jgi:ABC-type hemin transport system ATPase subunit